MAQENPYAKYRNQSQPVPIAQIKPIIAAPRDPYEADREARAQASEARAEQSAALQQSAEARAQAAAEREAARFEKEMTGVGRKPLREGDAQKLTDDVSSVEALERALNSFQDDFVGLTASAENLAQGVAGIGTPGQRDWWADFSATDNQIRNALFGASLTAGEKSAYASTTITPRMAPEEVRRNLQRRLEIARKAAARRFDRLNAAGYNPDEVAAVVGEVDIKTPVEQRVAPQEPQQLALTAGENFSTEQDKAIAAAVNQALANGADVQGLASAAQAAGGQISPDDIANFQAAVEARAQGQSVTFNPQKSGTRSPIAQAAGEALMTPAGTALTGAVNAAGLGALSQFAGDQVQGLEALNPKSALLGEVAGSMLGTAGLAKGTSAALGAVAPGIASRVAGGGLAGAVGREVLTEGAYGGLYAANTGEDIGTGIGLGAAGSLGGQAVAAGARRVAPAVGRLMGRGDVPPDGGVPPAGGMGGVDAQPTADAAISLERTKPHKWDISTKEMDQAGTIILHKKADGQPLPVVAMATLEGELRGVGNAAKAYDQIEAQLGERIAPSPDNLSDSAKSFWQKRLLSMPKDEALGLIDKSYRLNSQLPEPSVGRIAHLEDLRQVIENASQKNETFTPTTTTFRSGGAAGASDEGIRVTRAQELPVPIELARFQRSRLFEEQQRARDLAKNNEVGGPIRELLKEQQDKLRQNFDAFLDQTGAREWGNRREQGMVVDEALKTLAKRMNNKVNALYKRAEKSGELAEPVDMGGLADELNNLRAERTAAPVIKGLADELAVRELATGSLENGTLKMKRPLTLNEAEELRKKINRVAKQNDPNDLRVGAELKSLIDSLTENSGGEAYKAARAARKEVGDKFERVSLVKKLIGMKPGTTDRQVALENVVETAVTSGGTSLDDIKALKSVLDEAGPRGKRAWRELQGATLEHIQNKAYRSQTDESGQRVLFPSQLEKAIADLDKGGKLDFVFDKRTAELLRTMGEVSKDLFTAPPGSVNSSNTASAMTNAMDTLVTFMLSGAPIPAGKVSSSLINSLRSRGLRKEVKRLVSTEQN